jgi:hypothetical protein
MDNVNIDSALAFLRNLFPDNVTQMIIIPITEAELICTIASLKSKNSSGYDGVSNTILKPCGDYLGKSLAYIFNKSLSLGKFPHHLKYSIFKKR